MAMEYFTNFPIILYGNTNVRDISRRVVIDEHIRQSPNAFYGYDVPDYQRSDVLAYNYYGDAHWDWLLYLANGIVDPYYGWFLKQEEFNEFLVDKYGSLELAQSMTAYWQTNWADDDLTYAPNYYNRLPINQKKYFIPIWGPTSIIGYKRNPTDWFTNLNVLYEVQVTNTAQFASNTLVQAANTDLSVVGTGIVTSIINSTAMTVAQVLNKFDIGDTVQNWTTNAGFIDPNGVTITDLLLLQQSIPIDEVVYWQNITYYEMERGINESRKSLLVLNDPYKTSVGNALEKLLNKN